MLQAMNTGHDGSLTTVHANTPRDALSRLETMVLMSGAELPLRAIRDQISSAVNIVVQQSRFSDGKRRITHIAEIDGIENEYIRVHEIFTYRQTGRDKSGQTVGSYSATGHPSKLVTDLQSKGVTVDAVLL